MIPAGVDIAKDLRSAPDVAQRLGVKRLQKYHLARLPAPLSRPDATPLFWYAPHVEWYLTAPEDPLPELPQWKPRSKKDAAEWTHGAPDDLLDGVEAVSYLQELGLTITWETWKDYRAKGYAPQYEELVFGKFHWRRRTVKTWLANRPGERAGAGRPEGAKDKGPRKDPRRTRMEDAKASVRTVVAGRPDLTPQEQEREAVAHLVDEFDYSEGYARRLAAAALRAPSE